MGKIGSDSVAAYEELYQLTSSTMIVDQRAENYLAAGNLSYRSLVVKPVRFIYNEGGGQSRSKRPIDYDTID